MSDGKDDQSEALSQTEVVVQGIKRLIVEGELVPHAKLPVEKFLAPLLGVSRGSLREGVRALSAMGVLETRQGAGTYVTALDSALLLAPMSFVVDLQQSEGAEHLHAVRRFLETEAAGLAALHMSVDQLVEAEEILGACEIALESLPVDHAAILDADARFHRLVAASSGNSILATLSEALASKTVHARLWRAIADDHAERAALDEHRAVLRAIRQRDPERARLHMAHHLLGVEEFLSDQPSVDLAADAV